MNPEVIPIPLAMPFRLGTVNSYLIKASESFMLIDTGASGSRKNLLTALEKAGCVPGRLVMLVMTHGDFDHTGNAAYIRQVYRSKIAMHPDDAAMVEKGDMFINRNRPNILIRKLLNSFSGFSRSERFSPDLLLSGGENLTGFGFDAEIIEVPGHSPGSIAILTSNGDLFCGDLMENVQTPGLNSIMDNLAQAVSSLEKLARYPIRTVYPGHGKSFTMEQIKL